jgi:hypothetical protein
VLKLGGVGEEKGIVFREGEKKFIKKLKREINLA